MVPEHTKLVFFDFDGLIIGDQPDYNSYTEFLKMMSKNVNVNPVKRFGAKVFELGIRTFSKAYKEIRPTLPTFLVSELLFKGTTRTELYQVSKNLNVLDKNVKALKKLKVDLEKQFPVKFVCFSYSPLDIIQIVLDAEGMTSVKAFEGDNKNYVDILAPDFIFETDTITKFNYSEFCKSKKELVNMYLRRLNLQGISTEGYLSIGDRNQDEVGLYHIDTRFQNISVYSMRKTKEQFIKPDVGSQPLDYVSLMT